MLRDITIGQYYDTASSIHHLDPRTKIIATVVYIVGLFCVKSIIGFVLAGLCLGVIVFMAKIPLKFILRGLKPIIVILLFTVILNIFLVKGDVIWEWGILSISWQGIYTAIFMAFRLVMLIIGCSMMTLTTTPIELTDGLERLLRPLKKIHVPVHDIAMMMSIALRFIPILLEETDKIMKAQTARGADFETGNILARAKSLIPVLVPLFISAFRRADELATAMEARCYRGDEGRTRMKELRYRRADYVAKVLMVVFLGMIIGSRFLPGIRALSAMLF